MLPGRYSLFSFPKPVSRFPDGQVRPYQVFDDVQRILYFPLVKLDRWVFHNLHQGEVHAITAHGAHGECLGYTERYDFR